MAKKTLSNSLETKKKNSLFDLVKKVDSSAEILSESVLSRIPGYISTGSLLVNAAISGSLRGGVPVGRISTLCGPSGCGKSFLSVSVCREAQNQGYTVLYLDSENAIDEEFVKRLGCDTENFIIKQVSSINEVSTFLMNFCKDYQESKKNGEDLPPFIVVLDSLGNLQSSKEASDALEGKHVQDFSRSKEVKKLFRLCVVDIAKCQAPFVVVNHTYTNAMAFIPTQQMSGGCLVPEEKIVTEYGIKRMDEIEAGDKVLSFDGKYHLVMKVWNFTKPVYEIELNDGKKIKCSENHRFLTDSTNPYDLVSWTTARSLSTNDKIYCFDEGKLIENRIVSKSSFGEKKVIDLTVEDVHSYVSANGFVNHNSGIEYAGTVTLMMSASKIDDKQNEKAASKDVNSQSIKKLGQKVTVWPVKSRLSISRKVSFNIPYFKAISPYSGLEAWLDWDVCGIQIGKCYTQEEYDKLKSGDQSECEMFEYTNKETGEIQPRYAQPKKSMTRGVGIICKHLGRAVTVEEFYSPTVFTDEYIDFIDEKVIKPAFQLPSRDKFEAEVEDLNHDLGLDDTED